MIYGVCIPWNLVSRYEEDHEAAGLSDMALWCFCDVRTMHQLSDQLLCFQFLRQTSLPAALAALVFPQEGSKHPQTTVEDRSAPL